MRASGRRAGTMKNRAFHQGIKRTPYEALFGSQIKVGISSPIDDTYNLESEEDLKNVIGSTPSIQNQQDQHQNSSAIDKSEICDEPLIQSANDELKTANVEALISDVNCQPADPPNLVVESEQSLSSRPVCCVCTKEITGAHSCRKCNRSIFMLFVLLRKKIWKVEPKWIWGTADEITQIYIQEPTERSKDEIANKETNNPCDRVINNVPPDFRKMGLANSRISEVKCAEHIWHMNFRQETEKKKADCEQYQRDHGVNFITALGGRNTDPGEFPHMAAIGWKAVSGTWLFKCGGTLISNKFVLTAAHCSRISDRDSTVSDPVPKIVRLGDKNIADVKSNNIDPIDANILKITVHPLFDPPKTYNDIAIVELVNEVEFTYYLQPACLWSKHDTGALGLQAILTGWGVINTATLETSPELQAVTVDIIDSEKCNELLTLCSRKWCGMQENQICAGNLRGGADSCQGDSGGPLQVKLNLPITTQGTMSYVIGVTSFGKGCALPNTPGVYARVSAFIDWIEKIVWP